MSKFITGDDVVYCGKVWQVCRSGHYSDWDGHKYYKIYRLGDARYVRGDGLRRCYVF